MGIRAKIWKFSAVIAWLPWRCVSHVADTFPWLLQSHLNWEWIPIVPSPIKNITQLLTGFSEVFFTLCERGVRIPCSKLEHAGVFSLRSVSKQHTLITPWIKFTSLSFPFLIRNQDLRHVAHLSFKPSLQHSPVVVQRYNLRHRCVKIRFVFVCICVYMRVTEQRSGQEMQCVCPTDIVDALGVKGSDTACGSPGIKGHL